MHFDCAIRRRRSRVLFWGKKRPGKRLVWFWGSEPGFATFSNWSFWLNSRKCSSAEAIRLNNEVLLINRCWTLDCYPKLSDLVLIAWVNQLRPRGSGDVELTPEHSCKEFHRGIRRVVGVGSSHLLTSKEVDLARSGQQYCLWYSECYVVSC